MIFAGAIGNLVDCMFYGLMFNASTPYYTSYFVDFGTGYAPFLMGKVVDMFYFPLIVTTWPEWVPWWGGQDFIFFSPVFNFADSCISVGVVLLLLFYREEISKISLRDEKKDEEGRLEEGSVKAGENVESYEANGVDNDEANSVDNDEAKNV
jgi:signal peptidase II